MASRFYIANLLFTKIRQSPHLETKFRIKLLLVSRQCLNPVLCNIRFTSIANGNDNEKMSDYCLRFLIRNSTL